MPYWVGTLDDGSAVLFEVSEVGRPPGPSPVSRLSETIESTGDSIERSLDSVRRLAGSVVGKLREATPEPPDEIQVAFGLKIVAELQAFAIAKAGAEANYTVTIKWVKPRNEDRGKPGPLK
jgi:hypothetical protein